MNELDDLRAENESLKGILKTYMKMHEESRIMETKHMNRIKKLEKEKRRLEEDLEGWKKSSDVYYDPM